MSESDRVPVWDGSGWILKGSSAARLYERGFLGERLSSTKIRLSSAELAHAIDHRGVPQPSPRWLSKALADDPGALHAGLAFSSLRGPGDLVLLRSRSDVECSDKTWCLRWARGERPRSADPIAEIRWISASQMCDWGLELDWAREVHKAGRTSEVAVVDDEGSVTVFDISIANPKGGHVPPIVNDPNVLHMLEKSLELGRHTVHGLWVPDEVGWSIESLGVGVRGGRVLERTEVEWMKWLLRNRPSPERNDPVGLLDELICRGLLLRPGFKYGTRWRAYDCEVGDGHAPWLIAHVDEAPRDWNAACRASRLASGVRKAWLIAQRTNLGWSFSSLVRRRPGMHDT